MCVWVWVYVYMLVCSRAFIYVHICASLHICLYLLFFVCMHSYKYADMRVVGCLTIVQVPGVQSQVELNENTKKW